MLKKALLLASSTLLLNAATTMCYKKNHFDPDTIETIPLKGGKCDGVFSIEDMKKQGYTVTDIKISDGDSGLNYIYVLEKEDRQGKAFVNGKAMTKDDLKAYINDIREEEELEKKKEEKLASIADGKAMYEQHCQKCHGDGTISAYNVAKPLRKLSEEQFLDAIRAYNLNERSGSMVLLMKPYADMITDDETINIYNYMQTLKK